MKKLITFIIISTLVVLGFYMLGTAVQGELAASATQVSGYMAGSQ